MTIVINERIVKTKKNFPAIWEEGGGKTNSAHAIIICGINGEKLEPIYIRRKGELSCGRHALFLLKQGMYAIVLEKINDHSHIKIYKYEGKVFEQAGIYQDNILSAIPVNVFTAVKAAIEKSKHYHCTVPYYLIEKESDMR